MWFLFALVCLLGWGFADLFYKQSSAEGDGYSHLKLAVWVGLVMGAGAFAFLPFTVLIVKLASGEPSLISPATSMISPLRQVRSLTCAMGSVWQ